MAEDPHPSSRPEAAARTPRSPPDVAHLLPQALERRGEFFQRCRAEQTDAYRVFHGSQEGIPGVTIDRYGDFLLIQTFHQPLASEEFEALVALLHKAFPDLAVYRKDRSRGNRGAGDDVANSTDSEGAMRTRVACEAGLEFEIVPEHRGQDPWLFLDLRSTRRALRAEASGRSVLNLFAYTCGAGVAAAAGGARRVLNVDFARSSMEVGERNVLRNGAGGRSEQIVSDVFPALRQLAGDLQPRRQRGRRLPEFPKFAEESFDLVLLDPPKLARSPFGTVDLVRDYQSILKPSVRVVAPGGAIYCCNNVAAVDEEEWHTILRRCAAKAGRSVEQLDVIRPDEDFPSTDGRPPLKVARLQL